MDNKTIFLLSMLKCVEFDVPHIYSVNNENKYIDAIFEQEASLKATLSIGKIDRIIITLDSSTLSLFKIKEFNLKDFDIESYSEKDNKIALFLNRIKNFILNKEQYDDSIEIDPSLFLDKNNSNYLKEYLYNKDTKEKVNDYLNDLNEIDKYKFIYSLYTLSKDKASSINENNDVVISLKQYENENNQVINIASINKNIEKIKSIADHVDIVYDTKGLLNNDYHFLSNILQLADSNNNSITIKGVIDIYKNNNSYISSVINSKYVPDISFILSLLKGYKSTGKLATLKKLRDYYYDKKIPTKFLERYISALSFIESGVALCNISTLKFGIKVLKKVHDLPLNLENNENAKSIYLIFRGIIDDKFGLLINENKLYVSNLIEWCINNEYYQQTLTIIESLAPDEIVSKGIIYYAKNKEDSFNILEKWNYYYWKELARTRYIFNDLSHYFLKNYGRNAINNAQARDKALDDLIHTYLDATKGLVPKLGLLYTNLKDDQLLLDLLLSYYKIGNLRNEVAHALPQQQKDLEDLDNLGEDELYSKVKKETCYFYNLLKKALNEVSGDRPYLIFNRTFKEYTSTHMPNINNVNIKK